MFRESVVLSVLCIAFAEALIGLPDPIPEKFRNVPECTIEFLDQVINSGKAVFDRNGCMQILCEKDRIIFRACGAIDGNHPMKLSEYKIKRFRLLPKY